MANQRDKNKKSINLWVTDEERDMLKSAARKHGYASVTEFIKAAARGAVKVDPKIKALALAAVGANGGCVGHWRQSHEESRKAEAESKTSTPRTRQESSSPVAPS